MSIFCYRPRVGVLSIAVLTLLLVPPSSLAQDGSQPTEGYVQSLRSLYAKPDATSDTIGFIEPGEYVRLEHVNALVYRVFRKGEKDAAGYVVYPKVGPTSPLNASVTPIRSTNDGAMAVEEGTTVTDGEDRWVHNFANIRLRPNATASVVAQLPPGAQVLAGGANGTWTLVYKQNETRLDPSRALGYVHSSLLFATPPDPVPSPIAVKSNDDARPNAVKPTADIGARVNVNTADQRMLETLPRIGPVLAKRIIDFRDSNGEFRRVEDLVKVKGIGDKTLEKLLPYVTVGN